MRKRHLTLRWCHRSVLAYQITGDSTVSSTVNEFTGDRWLPSQRDINTEKKFMSWRFRAITVVYLKEPPVRWSVMHPTAEWKRGSFWRQNVPRGARCWNAHRCCDNWMMKKKHTLKRRCHFDEFVITDCNGRFFWQLPVQPVMKIASKLEHFRLSWSKPENENCSKLNQISLKCSNRLDR